MENTNHNQIQKQILYINTNSKHEQIILYPGKQTEIRTRKNGKFSEGVPEVERMTKSEDEEVEPESNSELRRFDDRILGAQLRSSLWLWWEGLEKKRMREGTKRVWKLGGREALRGFRQIFAIFVKFLGFYFCMFCLFANRKCSLSFLFLFFFFCLNLLFNCLFK